ncbi:PPPDE putative peptidase domain-containing protein [Tribonema minus]|uniref:PPPDE putative peptidase domain-containing protein n=1 Tax=Tribonema minus TaxID=303371 RepID=A0A835YYT1_9STRA|nr:PPPDE putative peptidase domain-containing protein [Tribonema minus]
MAKVQLALYDLSRGLARSMSMALLGRQVDGIWHTGVIVYGKEYFFSGGIQAMKHEDFCAMHGGFRPEQYIDLGKTQIPEDLLQDFLREISPRFTAMTYNLFRHNCNNFSDEVSRFLLDRGIPEYIINLPNEVLQTPMGRMMVPMVEQMTTELHGGDPLAHAPFQPPASVVHATPAPTAAPAAPAPAATPVAPPPPAAVPQRDASGNIYPLLSKHTKPLLSPDTSVITTVVKRLEGSDAVHHMSPGDKEVLKALSTALTAGSTASLPAGAYGLLARLRAAHQESEFKLMCLLRVMALHAPESLEQAQEQRKCVVPIFTSMGQDGPFRSAQGLAMALCAAANMFGTPAGAALMVEADVMAPCVDAALQHLHHARADVRQLASALVFNFALQLTTNGSSSADSGDMPDEITQILLGCLEGLLDESDDLTAERRLMAAGCVMRKYKTHCTELVEGCELGHHVTQFVHASPANSQAKHLAVEVAHLLQA